MRLPMRWMLRKPDKKGPPRSEDGVRRQRKSFLVLNVFLRCNPRRNEMKDQEYHGGLSELKLKAEFDDDI